MCEFKEIRKEIDVLLSYKRHIVISGQGKNLLLELGSILKRIDEMLELLIKTVEDLKGLPKSAHINQRILKIEQLIKEGTEL